MYPEPKFKYTVFPSEDPRSLILYQETKFANYVILPKEDVIHPRNSTDQGVWTLEFDDTCASTNLEAGVVLISPMGEIISHDFKLEFENTNNTTKYEALLLGIQEDKKKDIKALKSKGDVELVVKQVQNIFSIKNPRLKHYRNRVWDELEGFEAFSIEAIP